MRRSSVDDRSLMFGSKLAVGLPVPSAPFISKISVLGEPALILLITSTVAR